MRLAILIIGVQNSGKTSTIKHLINSYSFKTVSIMRRGWTDLYLHKNFKSLQLSVYCMPASPTESNADLVDNFEDWENLPQVLIVAEQLGGNRYGNTINFLNTNGYTIIPYTIPNTNGSGVWERFNTASMINKLDSRANEIIDDIKRYIRNNSIV